MQRILSQPPIPPPPPEKNIREQVGKETMNTALLQSIEGQTFWRKRQVPTNLVVSAIRKKVCLLYTQQQKESKYNVTSKSRNEAGKDKRVGYSETTVQTRTCMVVKEGLETAPGPMLAPATFANRHHRLTKQSCSSS